jgi:hypothetical protein
LYAAINMSVEVAHVIPLQLLYGLEALNSTQTLPAYPRQSSSASPLLSLSLNDLGTGPKVHLDMVLM